MGDDKSGGLSQLDSVAAIVRGLGFGGVGLIFWTTIFVAALVKGDAAVVEKHWGDLYFTWYLFAGLSSVGHIALGVTKWFADRGEARLRELEARRQPQVVAVALPAAQPQPAQADEQKKP